MGLRKFFKDMHWMQKFKTQTKLFWRIINFIELFLNLSYKLAMAFVPGIVCYFFLNNFFGVIVIIAGFYKFIIQGANCSSIKEFISQMKWSFQNK